MLFRAEGMAEKQLTSCIIPSLAVNLATLSSFQPANLECKGATRLLGKSCKAAALFK
jgi:hypothetical protein